MQSSASLSQAYPIMSATMRSSSFAARQNCCLEITISDGKWGAILELVAAITRVLTSRMKKRLRLWLTKLINLLVYANYIDIKWRVKNYRNLKKKNEIEQKEQQMCLPFARLLVLGLVYCAFSGIFLLEAV